MSEGRYHCEDCGADLELGEMICGYCGSASGIIIIMDEEKPCKSNQK